MTNPVDSLRNAVAFLDSCRADKTAGETGALRDAHEWLEAAAREVAQDDAITQFYRDRNRGGWATDQCRRCDGAGARFNNAKEEVTECVACNRAEYSDVVSDGGMDPRSH